MFYLSILAARWRTVADPGFPRRGGSNPPGEGGESQHTILPNSRKNCIQLKEFGPMGGGGRGHPLRSLRSTTGVVHCFLGIHINTSAPSPPRIAICSNRVERVMFSVMYVILFMGEGIPCYLSPKNPPCLPPPRSHIKTWDPAANTRSNWSSRGQQVWH